MASEGLRGDSEGSSIPFVGEDRERRQSGRRVTVDEAARHLGLTVDAIRKRVQREQIPFEKDGAGRVRIILDEPETLQDKSPDNTGHITAEDYRGELVEELRDRVRYLEKLLDEEREARTEERRREDTVIAQLSAANAEQARTIRELEAPQEASEVAETVEEAPSQAGEARDTSPGGYGPTSYTTTGLTIALLAVGIGIAAGVANPVLIVEAIQRNLDTQSILRLIWPALFLLWAFPPIFGLWLGKTVAILTASISARIEDLRKQIEGTEDTRNIEDTRKSEILEIDLRRMMYQRRRAELTPPLYAVIVGVAAVFSSLAAPYAFGIEMNLPTKNFTLTLLRVSVVAVAQGIIAAMFVLFTALIGIGRVQQRLAAVRTRAGGRGSAEPSAGNRRALIGQVGTIVTAVAGLIGVLVQIFYGNGGTGP